MERGPAETAFGRQVSRVRVQFLSDTDPPGQRGCFESVDGRAVGGQLGEDAVLRRRDECLAGLQEQRRGERGPSLRISGGGERRIRVEEALHLRGTVLADGGEELLDVIRLPRRSGGEGQGGGHEHQHRQHGGSSLRSP